eukprot:RCo040680
MAVPLCAGGSFAPEEPPLGACVAGGGVVRCPSDCPTAATVGDDDAVAAVYEVQPALWPCYFEENLREYTARLRGTLPQRKRVKERRRQSRYDASAGAGEDSAVLPASPPVFPMHSGAGNTSGPACPLFLRRNVRLVEQCRFRNPRERDCPYFGQLVTPAEVEEEQRRGQQWEQSWTEAEMATFVEQYRRHGKNFRMISLALPFRSPSDCVAFYYLNKCKGVFQEAYQNVRKRSPHCPLTRQNSGSRVFGWKVRRVLERQGPCAALDSMDALHNMREGCQLIFWWRAAFCHPTRSAALNLSYAASYSTPNNPLVDQPRFSKFLSPEDLPRLQYLLYEKHGFRSSQTAEFLQDYRSQVLSRLEPQLPPWDVSICSA